MSQLAEVLSVQKSLEESFLKKMADLEAQIKGAGPAKDTVAKVAEEFRSFRELIFNMLGMLRSQIQECSRQLDVLETRHRRKALVFQGIPEADGEDCRSVILEVVTKKLAIKNFTANSIKVCHRLGVASGVRPRPILVKLSTEDCKASIWRVKKGLRGSSISVKEFLTKARQAVFGRARQHFGMRSCWTQDGVIHLKAPDGSRYRITAAEELSLVLAKFPKSQDASSLSAA